MHQKITNLDSLRPLGGLDFDSEDSVISPQDARDILNCRYVVSYEGKINAFNNIKGNVEIPFTYTDRHRCIGSVQDTLSNSVIFFLWCSDPTKQKIMRYHRNDTSSTNPYGFIEQLIEFSFGWTQLTKISGVNLVQDNDSELLYWTDYKPRKINVGKASILNKTRCWDLYVPATPVFVVSALAEITSKALDGTVISYYGVPVNGGLTNKEGLQHIASVINGSIDKTLTATACDCHLEVCTTNSNVARVFFTLTRVSHSQVFPTLVVPSNWYGVDLIDRMFDAGKYPNGCDPLPEFKEDSNFLFNFVDGIDWQFRTRYYNDDYEITTLSPFSQIPLENIVCNPVKENRLNYVDVNFNDANLLDPRVLVIVKEVGLGFREGNAGVEKEINKIAICDFFDMDVANGYVPIAHYKFYNNVSPTAIPLDDANQAFDALPITARAQEYFRNRIVYGGIVEGYNAPECVNADLDVRVEDDLTPPTHEILVNIRIYNPFLSGQGSNTIAGSKAPTSFSSSPLDYRGGIFHDYQTDPDPTTMLYGGGFIDSGTFDYNTVAGTKFKQWLPEGGWACYCAGTDYFGISSQVPTGLPTTEAGAIITSNTLPSVQNYFVTQNGDVYSAVSIRVPDGTYVLRLASHWCSFDDKLGYGEYYNLKNGRNWHKTSTNVWGTTTGSTFTVNKEITVVVSGGDVFAGTFFVRDMCDAVDGDDTTDDTFAYAGYLLDALGNVDSEALKKEGLAVERTSMVLNGSTFPDQTDFSDHNGYFFLFGTASVGFNIRGFQVHNPAGSGFTEIATTSTTLGALAGVYFGTLQQLYDSTLSVIGNANNLLNDLILATKTIDARNNCSTFITGTVTDQNSTPIQDALVVYQGGRTALTNSNGEFHIVAFGNTVGAYVSGSNVPAVNDNNRILDNIIISEHSFCFPTYSTPNIILITITAFGANPSTVAPPYSPTAIYPTGNSVITLNLPIIYKSRKRGGQYNVGIVFYDRLLRQCSVAPVGEVYIPFTTEDLNLYNPTLPAGTYKQGQAFIDWALTGTPPTWAAFYQWVITKNKNQQTYLTWDIREAKYIVTTGELTTGTPPVTTFTYTETTFKNGDATLILLDISNINDYAKQNFDTNVSYTWQQGDRVRLIADADKVYYQGLFDYEVISFEQPGFLVIRADFSLAEIKSGTQIQVYRPRPLTEVQVFYEFGNCYECTNPDNSNNAYSVTSGTFSGGDTYFRNRSIPVYKNYYANLVEYYMECENISDFYASTDIDIGRLQLDSPVFDRIDRPALMRASDKFFPNTKINGLNRIRDIDSNRKELERKDGWIISLKTPDIVLQITQETAITSVYVERTIIRDAQEQEVMATSTNYFGTDNRLLGNYGGQFAGGVIERDAAVYGVDTTRGLSWRKADNGVYPISNYLARNYFGKYREIPIWDVQGVFDGFMKEYIVTIWKKFTKDGTVVSFGGLDGLVLDFTEPPNVQIGDTVDLTYTNFAGIVITVSSTVLALGVFTPTDVAFDTSPETHLRNIIKVAYRGDAETIAFSEAITEEGNRKNRWTTRYSFTQEKYESIGDEFVSWSAGVLYIHDKNVLRNNFNGIQYPMSVTVIYNAGQNVSMWFSTWLDTIQDNNSYNGVCNWSAPLISNTNGQLSRLVEGSFTKKEQYFHSEFKRDLTTLGVTSPIVNGRVLRNAQLKVTLENPTANEVVLRSTNALFETSQRNTQ